MARSVQMACPAKINLALAVGELDPDTGLHPICSWMSAIDLFDDLLVETIDTTQSTFSRAFHDGTPVDWPEEQDLIVKAHRLVEQSTGHELPVRVQLSKAIPQGGGLGGGSSNAAAMIKALDHCFDLHLSNDERLRLAGLLGSDVPFFFDSCQLPRPALVSGFGQSIERLSVTPECVLLVIPPFSCSTREVYRAFDTIEMGSSFRSRCDQVRQLAQRGIVRQPFNDLSVPAGLVQPRLVQIQDRIADRVHVPVFLSGSGSTLFLIGEEVQARDLREIVPECGIIETQTL